MNKTQVENAYLSAFCDRDTKAVQNAEQKAILFEQRADLKIKLKKASPDQRPEIQAQLNEITKKINE